MARQRSKRAARKDVADPESESLSADEVERTMSDAENGEPAEKDEVELELEKLVFGDEAGFLEGLKTHPSGELEDLSQGGSEVEDQTDEEAGGLEGVDDADLFFLDAGPSASTQDALVPIPTSDSEISQQGDAPAWEDSDDERMMVSLVGNPRLRKLRVSEAEDLVNGKEYTKRLRRQFERLYPVPEWANPSAARKPARKKRRTNSEGASSSGEESSSADEMDVEEQLSAQPLAKLLRNANDLIRQPEASQGKQGKLRPEVIDIQRTKDVGGIQPSAITSLSFHPSYPLLLSSGPASTLYLHHIAPHPPNPNPLLTSLHLRATPLSTTAFLPPTGNKIFLSGRRRYLHTWDLQTGQIGKLTRVYGHQDTQKTFERFKLSPCGRWLGLVSSARKGAGLVNILDANTLQWIAQARVEGRGGLADFAWWSDGQGLVLVSHAGDVVEWSLDERRLVGRWRDEGAVGTTVLALGGKIAGPNALGGDRWVAVGSSSGIVNIYDRRAWVSSSSEVSIPENPKPTRALDNLTTPISNLVFSPDGQILALSSRWKRDALRLVHLPSCTVYRNWPTSSTPLGRVTALAFSNVGGLLAVANEQGKIRLWEIRA
ncbi:MAG: hypothetical protein M1819_002652 [Sarea resinae]|nr:MAG: hypothetical protein M1819_002652 [Sarea resinae]